MSTAALTNLWNYIQGLNLSVDNRRWLAERLIESNNDNDTTNVRNSVRNLAYEICTEEEYQKFASEGFLDDPQPQYQSFTEEELEHHISVSDAEGYLTSERSAQFMDSLLKV